MLIRLACLLTLFFVAGCSVDEYRNVQRKPSCEECEKAGGRCITDRFCLLDGVPAPDAAVKDAAVGDAAGEDDASTGDAGNDAGATSCAKEGKVELCYGGEDPTTAGTLPCRAGTRVCRDGVFSECEGDVLPQAEDCNGEDDDCDSRVDEMLGDPSQCTLEHLKGECAIGLGVCSDGLKKCLQDTFPASDTCDGKDNDCDGQVDENTDLNCYGAATGCSVSASGEYQCTGSCRAGERACRDGSYDEECSGERRPASEDSCTESGQVSGDEDCDGEVDEGCECIAGTSCYTGPADTQGRGPCKAGTIACIDATHGTCEDEVRPQAEYCTNEGADDDCDGVQDNIPWRGTSCAAVSDAEGACKAGATWQCRDGELQCTNATAGEERCDAQNVDEDCDGAANEGFNLLTDRNNCGACGNVCGTGLSCCSGRCVNLTSNPSHCSACGMACASGTACCSNSCVDVRSDPSNCGTCGNVCGGLLRGCTDGVCTKLIL